MTNKCSHIVKADDPTKTCIRCGHSSQEPRECCEKCHGEFTPKYGENAYRCLNAYCECHNPGKGEKCLKCELYHTCELGKWSQEPQPVGDWRDVSYKVHGVLYELTRGELPDTQSALRKIDAIVESFLSSDRERVRAEEYKRCLAVLTRDHRDCPLPQTCIGYGNALSDLENNPPLTTPQQ